LIPPFTAGCQITNNLSNTDQETNFINGHIADKVGGFRFRSNVNDLLSMNNTNGIDAKVKMKVSNGDFTVSNGEMYVSNGGLHVQLGDVTVGLGNVNLGLGSLNMTSGVFSCQNLKIKHVSTDGSTDFVNTTSGTGGFTFSANGKTLLTLNKDNKVQMGDGGFTNALISSSTIKPVAYPGSVTLSKTNTRKILFYPAPLFLPQNVIFPTILQPDQLIPIATLTVPSNYFYSLKITLPLSFCGFENPPYFYDDIKTFTMYNPNIYITVRDSAGIDQDISQESIDFKNFTRTPITNKYDLNIDFSTQNIVSPSNIFGELSYYYLFDFQIGTVSFYFTPKAGNSYTILAKSTSVFSITPPTMTGSNALPDSTYYGMAVELPSADRAAYFTYATVPSDTQKIFLPDWTITPGDYTNPLTGTIETGNLNVLGRTIYMGNLSSNKPIPTTSSSDYGMSIHWNNSGGGGETALVNYGQSGSGSFQFYNCNSSGAPKLLFTIDSAGNLTTSGNITCNNLKVNGKISNN